MTLRVGNSCVAEWAIEAVSLDEVNDAVDVGVGVGGGVMVDVVDMVLLMETVSTWVPV